MNFVWRAGFYESQYYIYFVMCIWYKFWRVHASKQPLNCTVVTNDQFSKLCKSARLQSTQVCWTKETIMTTKNFHNHLGKWEQMLSHFGTCPIVQNWFIYYYYLAWSWKTGFGHHKIRVNVDSINSKPICYNQAQTRL